MPSNFSLGSSSESMLERSPAPGSGSGSALADGPKRFPEQTNGHGNATVTETEKRVEKRKTEDEKRRRRARNEEKWRKVRAREAAHDAPIRRWARFVQNRVGTKRAVVLAILGCLGIRLLLAWASLGEQLESILRQS